MRTCKITGFVLTSVLLFMSFFVWSCSEENPQFCVPNSTQICNCSASVEGVQTCLPDGSGYSTCECGQLDADIDDDADGNDDADADVVSDSDIDRDADEGVVDGWLIIHRDEYGVPFIYAANYDDAAYGIGYTMAEDQLPNVLRLLFRGSGQLSRYFGRGPGNRYLISDLRVRSLRLPQDASELFASEPAELRSFIESFANGLNHYLSENREEAPWADGYSVAAEDVYALTKYSDLMSQYSKALSDIDNASLPPEQCPDEADEDLSAQGSNAWAMTSPLTTGETILAGDPHLPWDLDPNDENDMGYFSYECHLDVDGRRIGGRFPLGSPMVTVGYSDDFAWTGTHSAADIADVYLLQRTAGDLVNPAELVFRIGDDLENPTVREETLQILGDGEAVEDFSFLVLETKIGPVCDQYGNCFIAPGVVGLENPDILLSFLLTTVGTRSSAITSFRLMEAITTDEISEIFELQHSAEGHTIVAGRNGDILYHHRARVPIRATDTSICYSKPLRSQTTAALPPFGTDGLYQIVPVDDHVTILNPSCGFFVNNNVAPDAMNNCTFCADLSYQRGLWNRPSTCDDDPPGVRTGGPRNQVIRRELDTAMAGSVDADTSIALAFDTEIISWPRYRALLEFIERYDPSLTDDPVEKAAVDELLAWDGRVTSDSAAPLLFAGWLGRLMQYGHVIGAVPEPTELPIEALVIARDALVAPVPAECTSLRDSDCCAAGVIPYLDEVALVGMSDAEGALIDWGAVHQLRLPGEELEDARPLSGGDRMLQTLFMHNATTTCPDFGIGEVDSGSSFVFHTVFRPAQEVEVWVAVPRGNLNDPSDEAYGRMSDLYASANMRQVILDGPQPGDFELKVRQ